MRLNAFLLLLGFSCHFQKEMVSEAIVVGKDLIIEVGSVGKRVSVPSSPQSGACLVNVLSLRRGKRAWLLLAFV